MKSEKIIYLTIITFAVILPVKFYFYFFIAALLLILNKDFRAFKFVRSKSFIFLLVLLLLIHPLLGGEKNISILGIKYSCDSFITGLQMIMRAAVIIPSVKLLFGNLHGSNVNNFWNKFGLTYFDSTFNMSKNLMPNLKDTTNNYFGGMSLNEKKQFLLNPIEFIARFLAVLLTTQNTADKNNYMKESS
jgi:hypothetical protein